MLDRNGIDKYTKIILKKGAKYPLSILSDSKLSKGDIILFGILLSIWENNNKLKINATNEFLSLFCRVEPVTVSCSISNLSKLGYIILDDCYNNKRTIRINPNFQKTPKIKYPTFILIKKDKTIRKKVFAKTNGFCTYCGRKLDFTKKWHIDHVQPKAKNGNNKIQNLVPSCIECNWLKRDKSLKEFKQLIKEKTLNRLEEIKYDAYGHIFGMSTEINKLIKSIKHNQVTFHAENLLIGENSIEKSHNGGLK